MYWKATPVNTTVKFKDLVIGDKFVLKYETEWVKHRKGGSRPIMTPEAYEVLHRWESYRIHPDKLSYLALYEKTGETTYKMSLVLEDFRYKSKHVHPHKVNGYLHPNLDVVRYNE